MGSAMQVIVKGLDGKQRVVPTYGVFTVKELKSKIFHHSEIPESFEFPVSLISCGRILNETSLLSSYKKEELQYLEIRVPLVGGGGDGGVTGAESRACYLSMYLDKKPDKVDPNESRLALWTRCHLSSDFLTPPCVIDYLGNLFNKDAIVEALLTKSLPSKFSHIKGLKDLINVHFSPNPSVNDFYNGSSGRFVCPITGLEFNGRFKFIALKNCGHVLSLKALKEIHASNCLICQAQFTELDQIIINGTEEEVQLMRERMEILKSKSKSKSKEKKVVSGTVQMQIQSTTDAAINPERSQNDMDSSKLDPVTVSEKSPLSIDGIGETKSKRKAETGMALSKAGNKTAKMEGSSSNKTKESNQVKERLRGCDRVPEPKTFNASEHTPEGATKSVYASIFTSSSKNTMKETYMCRNLPIGRN